MKFQRQEILFLAFVFLATIAIRIPATTFGLPSVEGADDRYLLIPALKIASFQEPATQFGIPDSTLFYGYGIVFRMVFEVLELFDISSGIHPLDDYVQYHATWPLMTVRVLNIGWVLGAQLLLYLISRRWASRPTAMWATALLAMSWMILEHTLYARPDIPSMVFVLLTVWYAMNIAERSLRKDYVVAGLAIGLSVATKYPLVLTAVPVVLAHLARTRRENISTFRALFQSKHLWLAAGIALLTFSVATPLFWPLLPRAIEQIRWEARITHPGADGLTFFGNLQFYVTHVLNYGIGTLVAVLGIFGILLSFRIKPWNAIILFSFPLALLIGLSFHGLHWDRWMLPILPFLALSAARSLSWIWSRIPKTTSAILVFTIFAIMVSIPVLQRLVRTEIALMQPDTRETAQEWLSRNLMPDARIVREPYTPPIQTATMQEFEVPAIGAKNDLAYRNDAIDYFISNVELRDRFFASPSTFPVFKTYYNHLLSQSLLIQRIEVPPSQRAETLVATSDWNVVRVPQFLSMRFGPTIEIYAFSNRAKLYHRD